MANPFPQIPFQTQLDFLWSELEGPEKKTLEAFQSGGYVTPQDYAEAFEKLFERSGGSALDKRKNYALEVFRAMEDPSKPQGLSQNAAIAYNYLLNKGLNAPQASGIVGNLMAESFGSIDPAAYNPKGGGQGALGIAQWRGPRLESLLKFAGMNGEKPMVQSTFGSGVPTAGTIFPQQKQQQQGGLRGLLSGFMQPSQTTGLTGPENFAAALDALILPQARMGEQIRARGAQRLQTQSRNKTIETLKQRAARGDNLAKMVLEGLESGAYDAKTAMSLYMGKKLETPKTTETFTTATGEQLNERFGTQLDPTKIYNISSTGKITQVGGAGVSIAGPEKEYEKKMGGYYAQKNIDLTTDATNAQSMLQTIDIQESLLNDPSFRSGSGQQLFDAASGFLSRFGIGEADLASNTAFQAFANKSVLDMLGGSLGTGVSNADVSFIRGTVATLDNTGESIAKLLMLQRKVAERKLKVAELARQWKVDNKTDFLDDRWDTYIANWNTENPIFPDADDYL